MKSVANLFAAIGFLAGFALAMYAISFPLQYNLASASAIQESSVYTMGSYWWMAAGVAFLFTICCLMIGLSPDKQ